MPQYKAIKVTKSSSGWGGPLVLKPTDDKYIVSSVTGGGIHPVVEKIAEMTGGKAVDGFNNSPAEDEVFCVVIDCGGTARCGVYPKKNIPTINVHAVGKSGPLAKFITEELYVSGVKEKNMDSLIKYTDEEVENKEKTKQEVTEDKKENKGYETHKKEAKAKQKKSGGFTGFIAKIGDVMGGVVNIFYQSGKQTIDQLITTIIPFMAFIAMLIGIINKTGIGEIIANQLSPLASSFPGLLLLTVIASLPFLSPVLGPGAIIAQVVGTLIGVEIGKGNIPPQFALPALFAINPQVGCDFIPVGLSLGEADPETTKIGVPAVLISRVITGPIATVIAYFASFGLY